MDHNGFTLVPARLIEGIWLIHHDGHETCFTVTLTDDGYVGRERARLRERKKVLAGLCGTPEQVVDALIRNQHMTEDGNMRLPDLSLRAVEIHRRGPGR